MIGGDSIGFSLSLSYPEVVTPEAQAGITTSLLYIFERLPWTRNGAFSSSTLRLILWSSFQRVAHVLVSETSWRKISANFCSNPIGSSSG